jgi:hypothetical protein
VARTRGGGDLDVCIIDHNRLDHKLPIQIAIGKGLDINAVSFTTKGWLEFDLYIDLHIIICNLFESYRRDFLRSTAESGVGGFYLLAPQAEANYRCSLRRP